MPRAPGGERPVAFGGALPIWSRTAGPTAGIWIVLDAAMFPDLWLVVLLAIAALVAAIARRLPIPYTVALVLAGLGLGSTHSVTVPELNQRLLYTVFLPGLLFEAAYHLTLADVRATKVRIIALAVPGVVFGMLVTAGLLALSGRFLAPVALPFRYGLVFAAIVAATDPIAVVAAFKDMRAPPTLRTIIEGESLLNDGTAIALLAVVMAFVTGGETSWLGGALFFGRVVLVGIAVGALLGFLASWFAKRADHALIEIIITVSVAYGSFAIAEHCQGSGVLGTVTAGMVARNYAVSPEARKIPRAAVSTFWEHAAFGLNTFVFLLLGFTVDGHALLAHWELAGVAFLVSLVARAVVVYLVSLALLGSREQIPWRWNALLTWGGLRGALSLVLALALPSGLPYRESIVAMTLGVVVLSLLVQGLSVARVLRTFR